MLEFNVHLAVGGVAVLGTPVLHLAAAGQLRKKEDMLSIYFLIFKVF